MTQDEARRDILREWLAWVAANNVTNANGTHGFLFFGFLQKERGHLLTFKASGDKWQVVHGWLLQAQLVSD